MGAPRDYWISLRILKMIFVSHFKPIKLHVEKANSKTGIFDTNLQHIEFRKKYIKKLTGSDMDLFIGKENLKNSPSFIFSLFSIIYVLSVFPMVIILSFFGKNKLKYPFHVLNSIEAMNLAYVLKKHDIKKLHFFSIYESDSNLLAYVLMKCGIYVNKIPSEVPLLFWNKIVVADSLSLCFRYQEAEIKAFSETMHVKEINQWVPESAFDLEVEYNSLDRTTAPNTIGFYSSGMWLRHELDILDIEDADKHEKTLLQYLFNFNLKYPQYKLEIYLHPLEKKYLSRAYNYYTQFSASPVFVDPNTSNSKRFFKSDVVVSLYSTLSFERIFWGFKTIVFPLGQPDFPLPYSEFSNICPKSEIELEVKLLEALKNPTDDFFVSNGISNYRYNSYNIFNN